MNAFIVESPAIDRHGLKVGTFKLYVRTEARAKEICDGHAERAWREVPVEEIPEHARKNLGF